MAGLANFDFICGNMTVPQDMDLSVKPYKLIEMPNKIKLAIASVLAINDGGIPDTHPQHVKEFSFDNPFEKALDFLFLRDSCDVFIYLNHLGFEDDVKLAEQLPAGKVDLIIGGHSHTKIDKEQIHNGVLITQAERKLKYATLIKLKIHSDGTVERNMQLLTINPKGKEKAEIRNMVDGFNDWPILKEQLAEAEDDFTSYDHVGYLMVDALQAGTGAEIALLNSGGVRIEYLPKGAIRIMDVYSMDPFGNEIVQFNLTGKEIQSLLQHAFKRDEYKPIYPAGMQLRYVLGEDGDVKEVQLFTAKGEAFDLEKCYTVVMNGYMASIYTYEHEDPGKGLFRPTAENMIEYLRQLKRVPSYRNVKRIEIVK